MKINDKEGSKMSEIIFEDIDGNEVKINDTVVAWLGDLFFVVQCDDGNYGFVNIHDDSFNINIVGDELIMFEEVKYNCNVYK